MIQNKSKNSSSFGMLMPNRAIDAEKYRWGFNDKENDNEVKGIGNQQDYGMRIYDARINRFLSVDPLAQKYPYYSSYQFAGNKPIKFVDIDGFEEGLLDDFIDYAKAKLVRAVNNAVEGIVRATVQYAMDKVKQLEVKPYAKAEAKTTIGYRGAFNIEKFGGFDVNTGSTELLGVKVEYNPSVAKKQEALFEFNYINKEGNQTKSGGINVSVPIEGVAGAGAGYNAVKTISKGETTSTTESVTAGPSIYGINTSVKGEKTVDNQTGGTKSTGTVSVGTQGAIGCGVVLEGSIEVGVKISLTKKDDD